jgi:hypothetical protein
MTEQERLEQIKNQTIINVDGLTDEIISREIHPDDYEWLIKQAERVNELETQNSGLYGRICKLNQDNNNLWYQNKRYKQALEFYADKKNYAKGLLPQNVLLDVGKVAVKALEGEA